MFCELSLVGSPRALATSTAKRMRQNSLRIVVASSLLFLCGCAAEEPATVTAPNGTYVNRRDAANGTAEPQLAPSAFTMSQVPVRAIPLTARTPASQKFARLAASETGVNFICRLDTQHPMRRLYHSGYVCGGVAIGDLDNDGRADLFLVSGADQNRLYKQVDSWRFSDITETAGIGGGQRWGTGAALVDIDNDGDLDIYVCNYDAPNQLFINDGQARFTESAAEWGLDVVDASLFPAFCDFDRDGDLDLYLLTNRYYREGGRPQKPPVKIVNGRPQVLPEYAKYYTITELAPGRFGIDDYGREDYLLVNTGEGRFADVTRSSGVYGPGYGLSATWWDYDDDGWPDLYVCNDFQEPDRLYHNNRDGTFSDKLVEAMPHISWFSMGSDTADINNDGLADLFVVDMSGTSHYKQKTTMGVMNAEKLASVAGPPPQYMRNSLLLNAGQGRFMEVAYLAGIADSDWSWAAKLADFDCDGRVDAFVSNGSVRNFNDSDIPYDDSMLIGRTKWDIYQHAPARPEQNLAFRNEGELKFSDVSQTWALNHVGMSYGAAWGDLDNDGDLDLVVANVDEPISLFRNDLHANHRVTFQLVGTRSNRYGLNSKIELETGSSTQVRLLSPFTGFLSVNQPIVHFGLGQDTEIRRVRIDWPSGQTQELDDLKADHHYVVREPDIEFASEVVEAAEATRPPTRPWFQPLSQFPAIVHQENPFDDFALQPLLPNKLSQLGPGMAWGDIDDDGDDDCFVGGGAGQPGSLWTNLGGGRFERRACAALDAHAAHEDMGALLFDADQDDDLDLLVVSGGYEASPKQDRLYLNSGDGSFQYASAALPAATHAGGAAAACDFDRDGDLDLFVGGRVVPGRYPLAPRSQLLQNDHGTFQDVAESAAPELADAGMVTSAVWSDTNNDGWADLIVAYEWGPIRLFRNQEGQLRDVTLSCGLAPHTGWWNGLATGDVDNDGDLDFVATNFGLNTKYHASADFPALLYYGDFDGSGTMQLVEAEFEDRHLFPIRGKSCSSNAMPFLREKFSTFKEFALADLGEIYTETCLKNAHKFSATTLESCVFLNDGETFRLVPLPRLAQNSPAFGVALVDVDGDGCLDLYVVQNFYGPQPETGHMDGGLSLLLRGDGQGNFTAVWPNASGLIVSGDGKSLTTVDLNADRRPDFVATNNQGPVQAFVQAVEERTPSRQVAVRLVGRMGNRTGIGAQVRLHFADGRQQLREIQAGNSYLSQSPPVAYFAMPDDAQPTEVDVVWPDGSRSTAAVDAQQSDYRLVQPESE